MINHTDYTRNAYATLQPSRQIIDVAKVARVYSGKPGCMCGCLGKYTTQAAHREWAGKNRGYAISDSEVNDRTVRLLVNKMNAQADRLEWDADGECAVLDLGTRTYCAYFVR